MNEEIEINCSNVSFEDYSTAQCFHSQKYRLISDSIIFVFCLLAFLLSQKYAFIILFLGYYVLRLFLMRYRLKKHWNVSPIYQNSKEDYLFCDNLGIHTKDDEGKLVATYWDKFLKFSESPKTFLLYLTPSLFIFIPKRIFSEPQIDSLRKLLKEKITSKNPMTKQALLQ